MSAASSRSAIACAWRSKRVRGEPSLFNKTNHARAPTVLGQVLFRRHFFESMVIRQQRQHDIVPRRRV
eukprot:scaffold17217_cov134-Isochrysis_galbana.AAC.5